MSFSYFNTGIAALISTLTPNYPERACKGQFYVFITEILAG